MKIILVISNSQGKNILFISDTLIPYSLEQLISLVKQGKITGLHIVKTKKGAYLRINPNNTIIDNLDSISIKISDVQKGINRYSFLLTKPQFQEFEKIRCENIKAADATEIVKIDKVPKRTIYEIRNHLEKYKIAICEASELFNINKNILGTLYSQGLKEPHANPKANDRGRQIQNEFYPIAKDILEK
ncbi:MAG: DUF3892 domain-containing protein [Candidatus Margulisiibacteriota bacterium]|jgi:hypothetical protein